MSMWIPVRQLRAASPQNASSALQPSSRSGPSRAETANETTISLYGPAVLSLYFMSQTMAMPRPSVVDTARQSRPSPCASSIALRAARLTWPLTIVARASYAWKGIETTAFELSTALFDAGKSMKRSSSRGWIARSWRSASATNVNATKTPLKAQQNRAHVCPPKRL
eukprot:Amastigsp_a176078_30.p2 type:complete len:167 gc:universal Amastigsp_a176078_30:1136-1636(+)